MKIRTIKYIIKDSIVNTYKNKLMSLASISAVVASLIIFGVFYVISINMNFNTKLLTQQPEIRVFCKPEDDDIQIGYIEEKIAKDSRVMSYRKISKQEAFELVKEMLGDDNSVLEGMDSSFLPVKFAVKLKNPREYEAAANEYKTIPGVENVDYSQKTVEFFSRLQYWIRVISLFLVILLLLISVFIISNTIRLTVFARRREINIMKYVGATDWFIRWPFVIEGVIIGIAGALVTFILVSYGYTAVENWFKGDLSYMTVYMIKIVKLKDIGLQMFAIFSLIGTAVGALGSLVSIRKYLRV